MTTKSYIILAGLLVGAILFMTGTAPEGRGEIIDDNTPIPPVGAEGGPSRVLTADETQQWLRGRRLFDHDFGINEGLGTPELNGDSCRACHEEPVIGGAGALDLNVFRFARDVSGTFQDLPGGQVASKLRPSTVPGREDHDLTANVFEQRQTPTAFGAGFIDGIADVDILANEDPTDSNGDGIFGVARIVPIASGGTEVGRFGWKAQIPRMMDFVRDASSGEIGLTVPDNGRGFGALTDNDAVADPEITDAELADMTFFLNHLAPPPRGGSTDPAVAQGEALFTQVGCATCHIPTMPSSEGPANLYSNLLLHNIMGGTFSGMEEPGAGSGFYRTPPLWGISKTAPYLHDGRAETLNDAIQMHQGEAAGVTAAFNALVPADQLALIKFLEDL